MGHHTTTGFGNLVSHYYAPDDDSKTLHISAEPPVSFGALRDHILEKWPEAQLDKVIIKSQRIRTHWDNHDGEVYVQYIVICNTALLEI